jgi:fucose 4-O-acetylase-like acetyltransferase
MENKNRIQIFDIAKGISIIMMTISRYSFTEIYPTLLSFQNIVMVFKMPAFIFISGYLLSDRLNFKSFLYQKIDGLIKPLISFAFSLTLLYIVLYSIVSDVVTFKGCLNYITNLARAFYHGSFDVINVSFWFIGGLFLGQVSLKAFLGILKLDKPLNYLFLTLFLIGVLILTSVKIKFYWTEYIPIFFTYLLLGYSFKIIGAKYFNGTLFFYGERMILFPLLFFISLVIIYKLNFAITFNIAGLHYNYHYILFLSILGVFSLLYLCRFIEKIHIISSPLVYCSRASFFILAYHIFIKDIFSILFDLKTYNPILHTLLFFLNIVLCCLIYMVLKRIPVVRIFFYPIKTIVLNDFEIRILTSKYVTKYIPKELLLTTNFV